MNWSKQFQTQHEKSFNVASAIPAHQVEEIHQQIVALRDKGVSSRAACRSLRHKDLLPLCINHKDKMFEYWEWWKSQPLEDKKFYVLYFLGSVAVGVLSTLAILSRAK